MKRKFTDKDARKINDLNEKLIVVEKKIFDLANIEHKRLKKLFKKSKKHNMDEFEVRFEISFLTTKEKDEYGDYLEIINWNESVYFESFEESNNPHGINDKQCHNVTRGHIDNKEINFQKHCWLLHELYDDHFVSWKNILRIDIVYFDIKITHGYTVKLKKVKYDKK